VLNFIIILFLACFRAIFQKPAAFYAKARLLFEKAGGLLKFSARAFLKSRRAFGIKLI
jgi:hypothetical protein